MDITRALINKYDQAVPRYTSYPTVPQWKLNSPDQSMWLFHVNRQLLSRPELSLYIHLPFCEQLCTYCGCNKRITKNHEVEERYIRALLAEWDQYLESFTTTPTLVELHLGGGTPTFFNPDNLQNLISSLLKNVNISDRPSFSFEAHPGSTTEGHLKGLNDLGFTRLSIGVQDVSEKVLKAINRYQTVNDVIRTTSKARDIGYDSINFDIIYGLPFQEARHIKNTMEVIGNLKPERIAFYSYAHVPWKSKSQRAFSIVDIAQGFDKYQLKQKGHELLKDAGYLAVGMDHYALPADSLGDAARNGRLHRNFMGYTDRKPNVLIGLGCSAISETPGMYVQNAKVVEQYEDKVMESNLALIKGHKLTKNEQATKVHLSNLFCNYKTDWQDTSINPEILRLDTPQLREMLSEGLLFLDKGSLAVSQSGKEFIRNICAALDPMYRSFKAEKQFSLAI